MNANKDLLEPRKATHCLKNLKVFRLILPLHSQIQMVGVGLYKRSSKWFCFVLFFFSRKQKFVPLGARQGGIIAAPV